MKHKTNNDHFPTLGEGDLTDSNAKGFALIATISVMVLLVMVALAMLSLSTIEIRQARQSDAKAVAQANARLGLMLAIGELQKYAGPDQRVTATASILDGNPETRQPDGIQNPNWVGVWRTDGLKSEPLDTPFILADEGKSKQSLTDRRQKIGYDREAEVLTWLVSGETPNPMNAGNTDDFVKLYQVKELPNGNASKDFDVFAKKVQVSQDDSTGSPQPVGHFAYWVSDEGVKAKFNIKDNYANKNPNKSDPSGGGYYKLLTAQRNELGHLFADYGSLDPEENYKVMTQEQARLSGLAQVEGYADVATAMRALRHDVTTYSKSLLVNVAEGGLKKNLTAYLNSSGSVPQLGSMTGITDTMPIIADVEKRETIGPKFGALRSWYDLKDKATGAFGSRVLDMETPNPISGVGVLNNSGGLDPTKFTKQPIHPVLKEAVYYVTSAYDETKLRAYELIYPRVVLWNPYNVRLKSKKMYAFIDVRIQFQAKYKFIYDRLDDGADNPASPTQGESHHNTSNMWGNTGPWNRIFAIPETTFEPGECLVFTTKPTGGMLEGKAVPYTPTSQNCDANMLTAMSDPSELYCFYLDKGVFDARYYKKIRIVEPNGDIRFEYKWVNDPNFQLSQVRKSTIKVELGGGTAWNGDNPTQNVYLFGATGNSANVVASSLGTSSFPVLQQIHLDNYSRGNNGRWTPRYLPAVTYNLRDRVSGQVPPDTLNVFGVRLRHQYESHSNRVHANIYNEPWHSSPILTSNVRAGRAHRWSHDNYFGQRYSNGSIDDNYSGPAAHLYSYGPYTQCRQWPEWNDSEVSPHYNNGKYVTSVFTDSSFGGGDHVYPMFDIPDKEVPLFSLAQLKHAQLTPYVWHPSYAIGNSFASPYIDNEGGTGQSWTEERTGWSNTLLKLVPGKNELVHRMSMSNGNPLVYDLSYEINHALWDRYFLTGLPTNYGSSWDVGKPLPNARYQINTVIPDAATSDVLSDYHRAAKGLFVDGGFNVNSTSALAWEALLRSFDGLDVPVQKSANSSGGGHPYPRFTVPVNGSATPTDVSDQELWSGYRKLTDQEIKLLAEKIVIEVKRRGPFLGLADFVNRRLQDNSNSSIKYNEIAYLGAIQSAIAQAGINEGIESNPASDFTLPKANVAANLEYGADYWGGPIRRPLKQNYDTAEYKKDNSDRTFSESAGAPGYLLQSDILQRVGATLTARSDTFVIRTYGDATDTNGNILAREWCEAVVQRTVDPIVPDTDSDGLNPRKDNAGNFGRRFRIVSFRWISADELN